MIWIAPEDVQQLLLKVKTKHHSPRLDEARVVVCFDDSKPFKKNRFNWGKTRKFTQDAKLFQHQRYDFSIILPQSSYNEILNAEQREAWLDLRLECCQAEMEPEVVEQNGKKKTVTDEWGRIVFTNEMKRDDDSGEPLWKVDPQDVLVIHSNISRFGCWCTEFVDLGDAVNKKEEMLKAG